MKTIVFIDTQKSGSSRDAIKIAEKLGYYTVLFTNRLGFIKKRTEFPDVHLMHFCDLNNIDELKKSIKLLISKALEISSIISFVDSYCYTAAKLAEEFGLNHFSTEAIGKMENKLLSRQILTNTPYSTDFFILSQDSAISKEQYEDHLPLVVKSPNSTGSKDVLKATTFDEFDSYVKKLFQKNKKSDVIAEEFLDGPQYLIECIVYKSKVNIIAIIEQEITFNNRFIITGYNLAFNLSIEFYKSLKSAVEDIIKAHGMECGSCHLEMRYVKNQWKVVEINPRISGAGMNQFLQTGLGINLVKETLKISLGQAPDLEPKLNEYTFAQYVTISRRGILQKVTGKNKALQSPGVKAVYIKPKRGTLLTPPISMGNRYAYVIATGDNEEKARENAKGAASKIVFWLSDEY